MTIFSPQESLGFHCSITFRAFASALEKALADTGISSAQFIAISHLMAFGPMAQSELAAHLSTSPVTVVGLIDRLEREGFVKRQPSEHDRRVKLVVPTAKAKMRWSQLTKDAHKLLDYAYKGIPKEKIELVKETLEEVRRNLETWMGKDT